MADANIIDLTILAEVIGNNPDKLQRFANKFVETTRAALAELQACLDRGDVARIGELGHRVKSSARIVGALGMGDLCERLEQLPVQPHEAALAQARELVLRMDPLLAAISSVIASPPSSPP